MKGDKLDFFIVSFGVFFACCILFFIDDITSFLLMTLPLFLNYHHNITNETCTCLPSFPFLPDPAYAHVPPIIEVLPQSIFDELLDFFIILTIILISTFLLMIFTIIFVSLLHKLEVFFGRTHR